MLGKETDKTNGSSYDIYTVGEHIRSRMHQTNLIKDRRYRLRKYKQCFVGRDAIDWLVRMCHAQSRGEAVMSLRILQEYGMLRHVTDDHVVKDQTLFYRFSRDDDSYLLHSDLTAFYRGLDVFNKIKDSSIRREFYHRGHLYQDAFYGNDLVDCLTARDDTVERADVIAHCRELLEFDIIRHVTDDYHFSDDRLMYQFHVDYERPCLLSDVLNQPSPSDTDAAHHTAARTSTSIRQASSSVDHPDTLVGSEGSSVDTHSMLGHSPNDSANANHAGTTISGNDNDRGDRDDGSLSLMAEKENIGDVQVSMVKRVVKLQQDEVGYGFVLRGAGPCYVHTVDPLGPAAAAGLKEGQYVLAVAGETVRQHDHRHVGRLVMTHTGLLTLVVLAKTIPDH
ncbi:DEP domain-containing mTOR-interacting protein-like [Littorina saxatilis]|uniref:DEP domain-containing mTOR-interacting protein n=1 Tax=Littorina saxatilis TaxID=31220 RepID=A0AAN9G9P4_9CAEN